jgi:predicted secreted protein
MKKTIRKLVVRSETLRTFRVLDNRDLTRAVGGTVVALRESGINCPAPAFAESGDNCPARAVAATAACG